jgi:hypothetical protein
MSRPVEALGRLAGRVTGRMVETVPADLILDHVDLDAFVDRIDINRLLDRVDVNRLLDRIDTERLLERIDLDALLRTVDVEELVRRSGVPEIVVESQTRLAGSLLDLIRRQFAGLDAVLGKVVDQLLRRDVPAQPTMPVLLREQL